MQAVKTEILDLWQEFKETQSIDTKHKILINYIWLVKYVLNQMNLPTNSILTDEDFLNIGILGLHEAILRFDPERGVKFESYAIPRIRGTIQDELRRLDWLSRTARKKAQDYLHATDQLRSQQGREASSYEIMEKLDVTPEQYQTYLSAAAAARASISLYDTQTQKNSDEEERDTLDELPDIDQESFLTVMENEERVDYITSFLEILPHKKKMVMMLYYYESLTFKEIGSVLNVSESRICQIHTQVIKDLRKKLNEFDNA